MDLNFKLAWLIELEMMEGLIFDFGKIPMVQIFGPCSLV